MVTSVELDQVNRLQEHELLALDEKGEEEVLALGRGPLQRNPAELCGRREAALTALPATDPCPSFLVDEWILNTKGEFLSLMKESLSN